LDTQKICPDHCLKSFIASTQNYGEGPTRAAAGAFKEDTTYTAQDVRFTTKGDINGVAVLYSAYLCRRLFLLALMAFAGKVPI